MSKSENAELWAERLRRFDRAGITVAAFCAAEGVSQPSYYHWRRKLRGPAIKAEPKTASPSAAFLPVALAGQAEQPDSRHRASATIELPGGIRIRVEVPTEPQPDRQSEDRS
jgi:transposase-like protein